jgi:hypothetical protein
VSVLDSWGNERRFTTSAFPNAWTLQYVLDPNVEPILSSAWQAITRIQSEITQAVREQEAEEDDAKERERERAVDNAVAREVDNESERM